MAKQKTRFKSLNIYVNDPKDTIIFYQQLGFFIVSSLSEDPQDRTHMMLSEKSDFMLSVVKANSENYHGCVSIELNEVVKIPSIEVSEIDIKNHKFL